MSHESYQSRPSSLDARLHRLSLAKPRNLADDRKWRDSRDYHRWDRSGSPSVSPIGKLLAKDAEWVGQRGTQPISCHRQSSEWETETLMDTASSSLDDGPRTQYPCPFRKRNPVRFNVRVYERCARAPFSSMTELKFHLFSHHRLERAGYRCRRCNLSFEAEEALEHHLMLPREEMCELNPSPGLEDPEDGIDGEKERILAAKSDPKECWTWEGIWRLLFPGDTDIPDSEFQPAIELAEVDQIFDDGQEALKTSLRGKLRLLLPDTIDDDYCSFMTGQLDLIFETHRADMMRKALSLGASPAAQEPLSRSQAAEHQSPPRRPNRRSRRSTILQATTKRHSRTISAKSAGHQRNKPSLSAPELSPDTLALPETKTTSPRPRAEPLPEDTIPAAPPTTDATDAATDDNNMPNPSRELRDSGIAMPCDNCECEPSLCKCSSSSCCCCSKAPLPAYLDAAVVEPGPTSQVDGTGLLLDMGNANRTGEPQEVRIIMAERIRPLGSPPHYRSPSPSWASRTWGMDRSSEGKGGMEGLLGEVGDRDGFVFSPQSFKQRVLRQQLMGT